MSVVTYDDWQQWKASQVTKAFFEAAQLRVEDAKEILGGTAGLDHASDNFYRGFIAAYQEMSEFRIEDLEGSNES